VKAARMLKEQGKRIFLVSHSAHMWINKVLTYLNVTDVFEQKYSGDEFEKKSYIFRTLAQEFDPKRMLSIGNQMENDIVPARTLGMHVFHVCSSAALYRLVTGK
jgi:FMN phosphatase YigB (HAD superfamily)